LIDALQSHRMGHILDIVPNHMESPSRQTRGGTTCSKTAPAALRPVLRHRMASGQDELANKVPIPIPAISTVQAQRQELD
jgi:hypothetical protein